jgi:hypothetical protein
MREQVFIDFEGTEDCRRERVPRMDMKHRTLWPDNQMSGLYMSSPVQNAWFAVIEQLAMVVGILGDIVANGTRYQKSVTAKTSAVNFETPEIWVQFRTVYHGD